MKVLARDKVPAEALVKAFHGRERFTLTGAGMTAFFVAESFSSEPCFTGSNYEFVSLGLTQIGYPIQLSEWNGEGLPPVGTDCETLWSSTTGEYVTVKVLAHDEDRAVVRFVTGSRKGEYDSDTQHTRYGAALPIFRPIRTPEQIAAEERRVEIKHIQAASVVNCGPYITESAAGAIYDAGYRKP